MNPDAAPTPQHDPFSRLERVRQKNSKAQKKYRQKKLDERRQLQQQAEELSVLVSRAEAERAAIAAQIADLEARVGNAHPSGAPPTAAKEAVYVPAEMTFEGMNPTAQQGIRLQTIFDPPRTWSYAQALRITLQEHCEMRKEFVLKAGQLLLANPEQDPDSPEGRQLHALINEFLGLTAYNAVFNPKMMYRMVSVRGDTLESSPTSDPCLWANITSKVRITEGQKAYLMSLMAECWERVQLLAVERKRLHRAIEACISATELSGQTASESILHTFNHVYFASLVRALRDNVDNTHVEHCKFGIKSGSTWAQQFSATGRPMGLNVFQEAQLLTLSWPHYPSRMSLVLETFMEGLAAKQAGSPGPPFPQPPQPAADEEPYKPVPYKILEVYMQQKLKLYDS